MTACDTTRVLSNLKRTHALVTTNVTKPTCLQDIEKQHQMQKFLQIAHQAVIFKNYFRNRSYCVLKSKIFGNFYLRCFTLGACSLS